MAIKFANNAVTFLSNIISAGSTAITVNDASVFPAISAPDYAYLTIADSNSLEIIRVTDITGNVLTCTRGADGSTAQAWDAGDRVELRVTNALLSELLLLTGGTMSGTLAMANNLITAAELRDISETAVSVSSSGGAITLDCEAAHWFYTTLTENITSVTFDNPAASSLAISFCWEINQDTTPRTINWPASVTWPGGTAPDLSTGSGEVDIFTFVTRDAGTTWRGFISGQNFS